MTMFCVLVLTVELYDVRTRVSGNGSAEPHNVIKLSSYRHVQSRASCGRLLSQLVFCCRKNLETFYNQLFVPKGQYYVEAPFLGTIH